MNNQRVEKLEKQVQRQQKLNWVLAIFIIGIVGLGFTQPMLENIAVRSLTIVDENGMPRIMLASEPDVTHPRAFIQHFDEKGKTKMWQGTEGEIMSTTYYDNNGDMRQSNGVHGEHKSTWYSFFDDDEVIAELSWVFGGEDFPQIVLGHGQMIGVEKILMFNEEMDIRIALDANHDGEPNIHLIDEDGVSRIVIGADGHGASGVTLYDETQELRWSAFTDELISGVSHFDKNGMERCTIAILEDSSTFFSINDQDEAFDILMGSVEDQILFSVDGEEGKNLHTKVPEITAMDNEQ